MLTDSTAPSELAPSESDDTPVSWESELAALLAALSSSQDELLQLLAEKRELLVRNDVPGLAAIQPREQQLIERLQSCHDRRLSLLAQAAQEGLPGDSIRALSAALPGGASRAMRDQIQQAQARARLLQHHSLTNWVLAQRSLLHVSQLLEIIATGGRMQPTYGDRESVHARGSLVNDEA